VIDRLSSIQTADRAALDFPLSRSVQNGFDVLRALFGYLNAAAVERVRAIRALAEGERGQGMVEYVGLILVVSPLMVGMVAAMKGFNKPLSKTRDPTKV
jgi:hypothetical protein